MNNILDELKGARSIGISSHIRPDGDCIGSCMGLYLYLKKAMPEALVEVFLEKPSEIFECIAGVDRILTDCGKERQFDVFIALDSVPERMGDASKYYDGAKKRINIDHHLSNPGCGDVSYVVPEASSTCELIYNVIDRKFMDQDIAKALYIGMMHDTGVFQYSNTSPSTLRAAADLISYGFDFSKLIDETFYEKSYHQSQILGRALLESILFLDGRCIVSVLEKRTLDFYGVGPQDLEGIVSQLRIIKGVECALFLYQTGVQEYKVSMRSNGSVDVSAVAAYFGGGGHKRASGCTMNGTAYDVINNLSLHIERQLNGE